MQKCRIHLKNQSFPALKLLNSLSTRESFLKRQVVHSPCVYSCRKGNRTALRAGVFCLKEGRLRGAAPRAVKFDLQPEQGRSGSHGFQGAMLSRNPVPPDQMSLCYPRSSPERQSCMICNLLFKGQEGRKRLGRGSQDRPAWPDYYDTSWFDCS